MSNLHLARIYVVNSYLAALSHHHLPGATFEAQPANAGCMPGTRVQFLEQVLTLLTARTGWHIAWIAVSQKLQGPDPPERPDQVAGALIMPEQA